MASEVGICNRALQKLGAKRITSLSEDSRNARACNAAYEEARDSELRKHPWNFAITRVSLAADTATPDWGRANQFTLPADCLRIHDPYPEDNYNGRDWVVEGRKILTDESAPLYLRYIAQITDPNTMDALFREALAARIAAETCEEITQSVSKLDAIKMNYTAVIRDAKRANAIENVPIEAVEDSWLSVRR